MGSHLSGYRCSCFYTVREDIEEDPPKGQMAKDTASVTENLHIREDPSGREDSSEGAVWAPVEDIELHCCERRCPLSHGKRLAQTCSSKLERNRTDPVGHCADLSEVTVREIQ